MILVDRCDPDPICGSLKDGPVPMPARHVPFRTYEQPCHPEARRPRRSGRSGNTLHRDWCRPPSSVHPPANPPADGTGPSGLRPSPPFAVPSSTSVLKQGRPLPATAAGHTASQRIIHSASRPAPAPCPPALISLFIQNSTRRSRGEHESMLTMRRCNRSQSLPKPFQSIVVTRRVQSNLTGQPQKQIACVKALEACA
ncbi:uncharacterized protein BDR25DRAFT_126943 [Lindgomyces ingoldianus]|uniref:Uncharacterized protein n=1 Tax=Lindgomyces ingoldianus TaxID=673940 RepID=A0ACB6R4L2_9PLEO|nr:uncharacterized protein BDR25DRAFT_126943 [Lindgomyces ingoldianus]KAF2474002.1 hypothetical protein BDR25DRAFT_126943 [Lindgomyces ingoldianus]